jgi:hypothetical protein
MEKGRTDESSIDYLKLFDGSTDEADADFLEK